MKQKITKDTVKKIIDDLLAEKKHPKVLQVCNRTLKIWSDFMEVHQIRFDVLQEMKEWENLQNAAKEFLETFPEDILGWQVLGFSLLKQEQFKEADIVAQNAIFMDPSDAKSWSLRGRIYRAQKKFRMACSCYHKAYALSPNDVEILTTFGVVQMDVGNYVKAIQLQNQAHRLAPNDENVLLNLGSALMAQGMLKKSIEVYHKAMNLKPDIPGIEWNLAFPLLLDNNYEQGFPALDGRFSLPETPKIDWLPESWNGENLQGGRLLIEAEQGFGDLLQFARFFEMAAQKDAKILLRCHPKMMKIMKGIYGLSDCYSAYETPPEHEARIALLSLPKVLALRSPKALRTAYLQAPKENIEIWKPRFAANTQKNIRNIGIVWQGNPTYAADHLRSIPLERYSTFLGEAGCEFFSLQKFHGLNQLHDLNSARAPTDLGKELDIREHAFEDTAAVISLLDLVITSDTSIAHLAGALGTPVWTMLPFAPDWRWGLQTETTPWYPNMRLFRQPKPNDWQSVVNKVHQELILLKNKN